MMVKAPLSAAMVRLVTGRTTQSLRSPTPTRLPMALSRPSASSTKKAGLLKTCPISKRVHFHAMTPMLARSKCGAGSGPDRARRTAGSFFSGLAARPPRASKR